MDIHHYSSCTISIGLEESKAVWGESPFKATSKRTHCFLLFPDAMIVASSFSFCDKGASILRYHDIMRIDIIDSAKFANMQFSQGKTPQTYENSRYPFLI